MKGLVIPSKVRMNQEGCTMINILRFFFSLWDKGRSRRGAKRLMISGAHVFSQ